MTGQTDDDTTEDDLEPVASSETDPTGSDDGLRARVARVADRAKSGFDEGVVDALSGLLRTETRTRVYVTLRQNPGSTVEGVASATGLAPKTVRTVLEDLVDEGTVERRERGASAGDDLSVVEGADAEKGAADAEKGANDGSETHEYTAKAPSELVGGAVEPLREGIGTVGDVEERVRDDDGDRAVRIEVDTGTTAEAEVGEARADAETDVEGEVEVDDEGARLAGETGGELDVETDDGETTVEGGVDATVGTDGVDVDVEADLDTPDDGADEGAPDDGSEASTAGEDDGSEASTGE